MLLAIYSYRWFVRPVIGDNCRFLPTCSMYAIEAIENYGPFKGVYLTLKRLLRCHPFSPGGIDPVINKRK